MMEVVVTVGAIRRQHPAFYRSDVVPVANRVEALKESVNKYCW